MVVDIPWSIPIVDMTKIVHIVLCGRLSELMAQLNPSIYQKCVRVENGQNVLYVHLKKAMYGTLWAALVFYQKLLKDMDSKGFYLNFYYPCVANKMVNSKHIIII